ncbi:uncharacterized protein LOC111638068 [Centruroides sculpturatus]|uniref:uncharacterized protein LOC111638068 n=1 Tax=Centruroides sculpturatus TaxID=218467 RepID=UPI000C6E6EBD|nr:uncharacterized protein LOC111638068 [Centruroides sculpturatus]
MSSIQDSDQNFVETIKYTIIPNGDSDESTDSDSYYLSSSEDSESSVESFYEEHPSDYTANNSSNMGKHSVESTLIVVENGNDKEAIRESLSENEGNLCNDIEIDLSDKKVENKCKEKKNEALQEDKQRRIIVSNDKVVDNIVKVSEMKQ